VGPDPEHFPDPSDPNSWKATGNCLVADIISSCPNLGFRVQRLTEVSVTITIKHLRIRTDAVAALFAPSAFDADATHRIPDITS
jgi:hypothetical protein